MIDASNPCYVFAFNLDFEGGGRNIESGALQANWVHIDYGFPDAAECLGALGLPKRVVQALVQPDTRPRTVASKEGTMVFIRGINVNPGADPEDMVSIRMWIEKDRLVTIRQRRSLSIQDTKEALLAGEGPVSIPDLVISIINRITDRISDYVNGVEEKIETLESLVESSDDQGSRVQVSAIRREIASVRRYLAPQRDALDALHTHSLASMPDGYAFRLREQMDRMVRYLEDLDLVREKILVLQEEAKYISMEQQNSRMYALSIVALIFLPVTFVTGVFGMNVAGLPGLDNPNAFIIVAGTMTAISLSVIVYLKNKRWF